MNLLGDVQLFEYLTKISALKTNAPKILAIFDYDSSDLVKKFKGSQIFTVVEKRIYGILLPKPSNRTTGTKFSIEHFFSDANLSISSNDFKLYSVKEFNDVGITFDNQKICKYLQ